MGFFPNKKESFKNCSFLSGKSNKDYANVYRRIQQSVFHNMQHCQWEKKKDLENGNLQRAAEANHSTINTYESQLTV